MAEHTRICMCKVGRLGGGRGESRGEGGAPKSAGAADSFQDGRIKRRHEASHEMDVNAEAWRALQHTCDAQRQQPPPPPPQTRVQRASERENAT